MASRSMGPARWVVLHRLVTAIRRAVTPGSPGFGERLAAVPRLVRATLRGEYAGVSRAHLLGLLAALVYVVSPVDLMPEGLLAVLGLADDAVLLAWMAAALVNDTEDFLGWEGGMPSPSSRFAQDSVRSHVVR